MIDLSSGSSGLITFSDGQKQRTELIEPCGDNYVVRIEHGWYNEYKKDGVAICSGVIVDRLGNVKEKVVGRSIIAFEPDTK